LIRKGEGPSGYSFVNQGEAQAFTAAAPIKKIASHFEAEMAKQGFKPMQSKKVSPVHQLDVFSKGDTAVIIELFSESGDFVRFIAEGQNPVAKGAVGIIIAMGKKTFF
jgi:hypothetical protein